MKEYNQLKSLKKQLTFGFEQTFTIEEWWTDEGFTSTSDTPLKYDKMEKLAREITKELGGDFFESKDIWGHRQFETFDALGRPSFVVTMDPGSIEVKSRPMKLHHIEKEFDLLFKAAEKAQCVPYRNWWYGVKGGTEGGCHINMGGFEKKNNFFFHNPHVLVQYCAYLHNRPFLHYPFMGPDVGPGGNAERLDEKADYQKIKDCFKSYSWSKTPAELREHFKATSLLDDKATFPSLYKFKAPEYLIEERAQEAFRSAREAFLVSNLRMAMFRDILKNNRVEELKEFPSLHKEELSLKHLWISFKKWANSNGLNAKPYGVFFERQFPKLMAGENLPKYMTVRQGRRPRVLTDIQKRGDVIVSKTVDTRFKRFEVHYPATMRLKLKASGTEDILGATRYRFQDQNFKCVLVDVCVDEKNPLLSLEVERASTLEQASFNLHSMLWE